MTPLESIEIRIAEIDKEALPLKEKLSSLLDERNSLIRARTILLRGPDATTVRKKWSMEVIASIEERIEAGETPRSIAGDYGMKTQTLYATLSRHRRKMCNVA